MERWSRLATGQVLENDERPNLQQPVLFVQTNSDFPGKRLGLSRSHRALKIHSHALAGGGRPKDGYLLHRLQTCGIYPWIATRHHEIRFARLTISPYDDCDVSAGSIRRIQGMLVEIVLYLCFDCFQVAAEICVVMR
jgi:hypothetical protein